MLLAATSVPSFLQAGEKQPTLSIKNQKIAIDSQWDVIVVGGGPAGCTAATAAAREGAKTLLIEATGQLGGMGTTRNDSRLVSLLRRRKNHLPGIGREGIPRR